MTQKTAERLKKEIREIEGLIMFRPNLRKMKDLQDWEPSALLSSDRNSLIRLGILESFLSINMWIDSIIARRLRSAKVRAPKPAKKGMPEKRLLSKPCFEDKRRILSEVTKVPKDVAAFLRALSRLKSAVTNVYLPESEKNNRALLYKGRNVFTLGAFRQFMKDASRTEHYLIRESTGVRIDGDSPLRGLSPSPQRKESS